MMADHGLLSTSRAKGINLNQGAILDGAPSTFDNDRTHHSHGFLRVSSKHSQHARLAWSSVYQLSDFKNRYYISDDVYLLASSRVKQVSKIFSIQFAN